MAERETETRRPLLADRGRIGKILSACGCDYSSHAFDSVWLWRERMGLTVLLQEELFAVRCSLRGDNTWFFPYGEPGAVREFLAKHTEESDFELCYVGERECACLEQYFPGRFRLQREEAADEYIYSVSEHLQLAGGRYANVRTQLHKAQRDYRCETKLLSEETVPAVLEILTAWEESAARRRPYAVGNDLSEQEALTCRRELGLEGVVVYLDGAPFGAACGYPLSDDTFDLFMAKERECLPGMSYYVKHELFCHLKDRYAYVNIEEDLGDAGLRRMKESLAPVRKNRMWTAKAIGKENVGQGNVRQ